MITVISDDEARDNLAKNVTFLLGERGLTQRDLAAASQRPLMSINRVCLGKNLPSVGLVAAIAEAFGYTMEEMIGPSSRIESRELLARRGKKTLATA